ncbi:MAG: hypothetical protein ABI638_04945 [Ignavibacteriota bacterium]
MKNQFLKTLSINLILGLTITFCFNDNLYSQQLNKLFDVPGGGSSGNTNTVIEPNDNTMLYLVGGAVIVGIVVYALMKDKKEKLSKDTTTVILHDDFLQKQLTLNDEMLKYKSQIPINISFGMQGNKMIRNEKRYFVGMSYNF